MLESAASYLHLRLRKSAVIETLRCNSAIGVWDSIRAQIDPGSACEFPPFLIHHSFILPYCCIYPSFLHLCFFITSLNLAEHSFIYHFLLSRIIVNNKLYLILSFRFLHLSHRSPQRHFKTQELIALALNGHQIPPTSTLLHLISGY